MLLTAASDDRLYAVYVLALLLGLRRGELLGLRWSSVDLQRGTLRVQKVRFHDLRHSCASLLFELGVPLRMVTEILGHSQIGTTSDLYTHVMPAQYREVADALDAWLDGHGQADEGGGADAE